MPFSKIKKMNKLNEDKCHSPNDEAMFLTGLCKICKLLNNGKRVYLFRSLGSVTVEAALCIGAFMICVFGIISYGSLLNTQLSVEKTINNIALETAKAKYYVNYSGDKKDAEEMVSVAYLSGRILSATYNCSKLVSGLNPTESNMKNGNVDAKVYYTAKEMITGRRWLVFQRAKVKDWTGEDITEENEMVYITKYGKVYHRSKECSHLVINIEETSVALVKLKRNDYGKKYSRCAYCARKGLDALATVFVTTDGDKYHASLSCGGLTRRIIEVNIKDVGNRKPCSSCGS